jgi:prolyl 4-hydroxylase
MVYLNEVEEGGETEFININHTFIPKQGRAVSWNNLTKQGAGNHNTMHQAHPVLKGNKAVITKWFRQESNGEMFERTANLRIKSYTKEGFKKTKLDNDLFKEILGFYHKNRSKDENEYIEGNFVYIPESRKEASRIIKLPKELKEKIHLSLQKPLEDWSNLILEPTFVYGIRVYQEGSLLIPHRDRENTHIISAIINVAQEIEEEWPLIIEDHFYRKHEVVLKPGEVIYYESSKLLHGRPIPLKGKSFANVFCHFMPKDEL